MDQAFDTLFKLNERAVIGDANDPPVNVRADRIAMLSVEPRIGSELLEAKRHALLVLIVLKDLHLNLVANIDEVARVCEASPRHIGDVKQAVDTAEIDKRAVFRQVLDDAGQHR